MQTPHCYSAGVSRAGARTGLQLPGHGDMQGFNSSSPAQRAGQLGNVSKAHLDLQSWRCQWFVKVCVRKCLLWHFLNGRIPKSSKLESCVTRARPWQCTKNWRRDRCPELAAYPRRESNPHLLLSVLEWKTTDRMEAPYPLDHAGCAHLPEKLPVNCPAATRTRQR